MVQGGHEIVLWCWEVMKLSCGAGGHDIFL